LQLLFVRGGLLSGLGSRESRGRANQRTLQRLGKKKAQKATKGRRQP
jgi:hypothetical protein